jgi:hypothetical protein
MNAFDPVHGAIISFPELRSCSKSVMFLIVVTAIFFIGANCAAHFAAARQRSISSIYKAIS